MWSVKGWLYCFMWYSSILAGYAGLFCPLLPLLFISNKLYRYCTDALFTFWQYYPTVLLQTLCGCDVQVSGDAILTHETSLIIMNHRTRTDWNFLWPTLYHCVSGRNQFRHPTKFVLKDPIRHMPGPGWVMQLASFVFIKRNWMSDKITLDRAVSYFTDLGYKYSLLLFPEGTDFTPTTKHISDCFAQRHGFQLYHYVLHPKTTGFVFLARRLLEKRALDAVYDVTSVYPDTIPQSEICLIRGEFPKQVKIHLARYPSSVLPRSEEGLREFLVKRWADKERTLREYHATGQFLHGRILKGNQNFLLVLALVFWSLLPPCVLHAFCTLRWFQLLVAVHTVFLVVLNFTTDGFQNFEIEVFDLKKRLLGWG